MADVPWREHHVEGRRLGDLLAQVGYFHDGHRAGADVDGTLTLLRHRFDDGTAALSSMLEGATAPSWIVSARGAPFSTKGALRSRGYRWDPIGRTWWRELREAGRDDEEWWLAREIYPGGGSPSWTRIDWKTRYA